MVHVKHSLRSVEGEDLYPYIQYLVSKILATRRADFLLIYSHRLMHYTIMGAFNVIVFNFLMIPLL